MIAEFRMNSGSSGATVQVALTEPTSVQCCGPGPPKPQSPAGAAIFPQISLDARHGPPRALSAPILQFGG
jgi:hypothetical protein